MSVKKILAAAVALIMAALGSYASAAENGVKLTQNAENDMLHLDITNADFDGKQVSFYLFKPGKSAADLRADGSTAAKDAIYQVLIFDFNGESVSADIKMKQPECDNHTYKYLAISQKGEKIEGEFEYYSKAEKDTLIADINEARLNGNVPQNLAEKVYNYFNLKSFELYESVADKGKIGSIIMSLCRDTEVDANNIIDFFEAACIIEAFDEGAEKLFGENGFLYDSYIALDGTYLTYYNDKLSDSGKKSCITDIFGKGAGTIEGLKKEIEKRIVVHAINDNKLKGYGHIENVISDFESDFTDAGLKIEKYNSADKNSVGSEYMKKVNTSVNTIEKIAALLNEIMSGEGAGGTGGASGSASSGGSKKNNSSGPVVAPPTTLPANQEEAKDVTFADLNGYDWAREEIDNLYKKGIISGRTQNSFAPSDSVTREEFTVLLVKTFELNGAADVVFDDVSPDRWSYEYITKAYAAGAISGDGKNFMPAENITRQDIAAIILRTLMSKNIITDVKPADGIFKDENNISDYAKESVQIMNTMGILNGDENGYFRPKDNATRAEAAVILARTLKMI